jgi:CYTH domain-containing protein
MNKTFRTEYRRLFLLERLPEGINRADEHLQFFDNYIDNTRLRLRTTRQPHTKTWQYALEQIEPGEEINSWSISTILLNEAEHYAFSAFEGREIKRNERIETNEIRFNRYTYNGLDIDVFLGKEIWGLVIATMRFEERQEMDAAASPEFAILEITGNSFFIGENLIGKSFESVREEFERIQRA